MRISVNVVLDSTEHFPNSPDQGAQKVLVALGGDPMKDSCTMNIQQTAVGKAGTAPVPPT